MTDWYYEESGAQRGPVSEADLRVMLGNGLLAHDTRVWTAKFGTRWLPASQTELHAAGGPPPLTGGAGAPPPLGAARYTPPVQAGAYSAASATVAYKPTYANLLALVLMIVMAMEIIALAVGVSPYSRAFQRGGTFWTAALSFLFAYKDANRIKAAGLNRENRTLVPFLLLTQIGYFLRRKSIAGLPLTPLWLWIGSVVVYVIFYGVIYG
ncbi:DUF4339 domain-containing protein [Mesorhizobium sp. PUT5]|uniref:DUF4339 domain-containing protein n=1 Tax=Mesorhizobium sp. PUT5 TaxID=3454629 RepID=UPI003FA4B9C8